MTKPRTKNGNGTAFPYPFEKYGRKGTIQRWQDGKKFGTYYVNAGAKHRNSFTNFEAAYAFLEHTFDGLDKGLLPGSLDAGSLPRLRTFNELEQLLNEKVPNATMREAIDFFIAHRKHGRFEPKTVSECVEKFLADKKDENLSEMDIQTLEKHTKRFKTDFGNRFIHEISAEEFKNWLGSQTAEGGQAWSAKTRKNVRGSLVRLSLHAKDVLKAIPEAEKTEFQKVKAPKITVAKEVEIYSPEELKKLLFGALEYDIDLIPGLIVCNFCGLRPYEFHAEGMNPDNKQGKREPLPWEAFNWNDKRLHVVWQKIRSKATRDVPLQAATLAWLEPFKGLTGEMWTYKKAFDDKLRTLGQKKSVGVSRIYDGFRHSYASYRIRQAKQDLALVAAEMGNSPQELLNSYKRNVTDKQAEEWFAIMPPQGYAEKVALHLSRNAL